MIAHLLEKLHSKNKTPTVPCLHWTAEKLSRPTMEPTLMLTASQSFNITKVDGLSISELYTSVYKMLYKAVEEKLQEVIAEQYGIFHIERPYCKVYSYNQETMAEIKVIQLITREKD